MKSPIEMVTPLLEPMDAVFLVDIGGAGERDYFAAPITSAITKYSEHRA